MKEGKNISRFREQPPLDLGKLFFPSEILANMVPTRGGTIIPLGKKYPATKARFDLLKEVTKGK